MSKKKLLEFGLKEADAFQKNFKIIFDRLVRGYKSMMGKDPEGLDLLKVKMEAREKALNTTKIVNQKGLTLDPDKPIVGGTQEGIETIKIKELDDFNLSKGQRPFGDNIRDAYSKAGRDRKDASEMIEALDSPGAKQSYEIMEEALGVKLYGDETFEELMKIKETGVHPRQMSYEDAVKLEQEKANKDPDYIMKILDPDDFADGGRVPASPSQLVSESDMILGYRGDDAYGGGRGGGGRGGGGGGGGQDASQPDFSPSPSPASAPKDLGFIGGPRVNPNLSIKGPDIITAPPTDPRFSGYRPSGFDPGNQNIFQKGVNLVKKTVTNPFVKNLGIGFLGGPLATKFGLTKQIDIFNKVRAIKGLYDNIDSIVDVAADEELGSIENTDVTGQTTALYKDGGLVTLFTEKR